jgi:hypothetical protein
MNPAVPGIWDSLIFLPIYAVSEHSCEPTKQRALWTVFSLRIDMANRQFINNWPACHRGQSSLWEISIVGITAAFEQRCHAPTPFVESHSHIFQSRGSRALVDTLFIVEDEATATTIAG